MHSNDGSRRGVEKKTEWTVHRIISFPFGRQSAPPEQKKEVEFIRVSPFV